MKLLDDSQKPRQSLYTDVTSKQEPDCLVGFGQYTRTSSRRDRLRGAMGEIVGDLCMGEIVGDSGHAMV